MEHNHDVMEVCKIMFLYKWVICRFQPLIFKGLSKASSFYTGLNFKIIISREVIARLKTPGVGSDEFGLFWLECLIHSQGAIYIYNVKYVYFILVFQQSLKEPPNTVLGCHGSHPCSASHTEARHFAITQPCKLQCYHRSCSTRSLDLPSKERGGFSMVQGSLKY